jgi:hypothetical protein
VRRKEGGRESRKREGEKEGRKKEGEKEEGRREGRRKVHPFIQHLPGLVLGNRQESCPQRLYNLVNLKVIWDCKTVTPSHKTLLLPLFCKCIAFIINVIMPIKENVKAIRSKNKLFPIQE